MTDETAVIVGAGPAGVATADALLVAGYDGRIVLVGDEPHHPYDRPPLSKQVLAGEWELDRVRFGSSKALADDRVELRSGVAAAGLDPAAQKVMLDDGTVIAFDHLVVATGLRPRQLPFGHDLGGVHVLRGLDDARALRDALQGGPRVTVIGAGFLGCEVAAVAREIGAEVDLVDVLDRPLVTALGDEIADLLAETHRHHGVTLHLPERVVAIEEEAGRVRSVVLGDGTVLDTDVVVVAIGSVPAVEWLSGAGLQLGGPAPGDGAGGILCDSSGRAAPGVYAVGDVAAWWSESEQCHRRTEHRLTANEHARAVAHAIVGTPAPGAPAAPFFWSDQYDLKIQVYGSTAGHDRFGVVEGSMEQGRFVAAYGRGGRITGVLGVNSVKALRSWRRAVVENWAWDETRASA